MLEIGRLIILKGWVNKHIRMDLCIKGSGSMERNMGGEFLNGEVAKYTKALFKMDKCMAKENSTSLGQKVNT